jgi:hypothetical protein
MEFNLNTFLKKYKPKSLKEQLKPYLSNSRLKKYTLLENNIENIVPACTYIKYINIETAFSNNDYNSHIRTGGILLAGGNIVNSKFQQSNDRETWKYLLIKYDPSIYDDKDAERREVRTYIISLKKNYIFYYKFGNNMKELLRNIEIIFE